MTKKQIADKTKLYAIRFSDEKEASEIVMNVELNRNGFKGICYLTPPDRGHMIHGKAINAAQNSFAFIADYGAEHQEEWEFIEVTYDSFKAKYHKLVYGGEQISAQVHSTKELEDYFNSSFPDYT